MRYRRASFLAGLLLLVMAAVLGVKGGVDEWPGARSVGQRVATVTQLGYGLFAALAALGLALQSTWSRPLILAWAVALVVTGGLAPVVWGDASVLTGVVAALSASLVAYGVIWLSRRTLEP